MKKFLNKLGANRLIQSLKKRSFDKQSVVIISIIFFVAANILMQAVSLRLDLSKGQAYTLSPSTKKIVSKLPDVVNITFYVSSDLPTRLVPLKTEVLNLLSEYKKTSGKITVKTEDPKKDTAAQKAVSDLGIPELQFSQLEKDKYQISTAYFGLGVAYGGKKEAIPQATDITNLEYNITSSIYRLEKKELDKVALVGTPAQAAGNPQSDPYVFLKTVLASQYDMRELDIRDENAKEIPQDLKYVILVASDNSKFGDRELSMVKKYLDNGGKMMVLADGVWVNEDLSTAPADNNLFALLKGYGIGINKNLVLSASAEYVNFGNTSYQYFTPYPFWVKSSSLNAKSGYFANVSSLTFPWTSSLTVDPKKGVVLVKSPAQSWTQDKDFALYPQNITEPSASQLKQLPLIAQAGLKKNGSLTVVPSSRFLNAQYLSKTSGNIEFAFNLINNLVSGGALTGIRSRSVNLYPLPNIPDNEKELVKYLDILMLPALFALYGAVRLIRRK